MEHVYCVLCMYVELIIRSEMVQRLVEVDVFEYIFALFSHFACSYRVPISQFSLFFVQLCILTIVHCTVSSLGWIVFIFDFQLSSGYIIASSVYWFCRECMCVWMEKIYFVLGIFFSFKLRSLSFHFTYATHLDLIRLLCAFVHSLLFLVYFPSLCHWVPFI